MISQTCTAGTTLKNKLSTCFFYHFVQSYEDTRLLQGCCKTSKMFALKYFASECRKTITVHAIRVQWPCPLLHNCAKNAAKSTTINELYCCLKFYENPHEICNFDCNLQHGPTPCRKSHSQMIIQLMSNTLKTKQTA